jgi:RNA polymerase sigma factor (sigma-70 family)
MALLANQLSPTSGQLDQATERRLIRLAQKGDVEARNTLVNSVGLLVVAMAIRTGRDPHDHMEAFQSGVLGVYRAIENFNLAYQCRFSTYATWYIRQAIQSMIRSNIRYRRRRVEDEITQNSSLPGPEEIAEFNDAREQWRQYLNKLYDGIDSLMPREADIVYGRLDREETLEVASKRLKISKERVRQILQRSYRKISAKIEPCPPEALPKNWDTACYAAAAG